MTPSRSLERNSKATQIGLGFISLSQAWPPGLGFVSLFSQAWPFSPRSRSWFQPFPTSCFNLIPNRLLDLFATRSPISSRPPKRSCIYIPSRQPNGLPFQSHSHHAVNKHEPFILPSLGKARTKSACDGRGGLIPSRGVSKQFPSRGTAVPGKSNR